MGFCNLRSLLLAAVVISNCITWTASRHHYTHNSSGHRSRHRRQGAGLYLPASYVIPGGEGSGAWGDWGEVSPCSRTCGGGVASQKRICLQVGSNGRPLCRGGDTKYFSCQTQDCPPGSPDFRAQQCSEHDEETFRGVKYKWVPYTKAPNPCELNCMPKSERFYYRHSSKVIDGTRCDDESFDVCVNGTCQPVGCDMMLGSNAREDKCRECRGNNTNCHTVTGSIPPDQELRRGYNDLILIPEGATNIHIYEVRNSNNYLALRSRNNVYYLNGDYHIDFPRRMPIAGAMWVYERSQQGFAAPDILRCLGPTNEPLYLSILLQEDNVGIEYEYSIPKSLAPPPNQQYNWVHGDFTPCSVTCGGGFQTRAVTCRSREELEVVDDNLCDEGLKPPTNATCNTQPCAARWVEGPWSPCSEPCGKNGTRSRQVHCEKIIANGYPSIVADKECFDILGEPPKLFEKCNQGAFCPKWYTGPWKSCDKLCGEGKQTREVVCYQKTNGRVEVLPEADCAEEKPPAEQSCILHPCEGVDWVVSDWVGCDSCLSTVRTRTAECATKDKEVVNSTFCNYHPAPVLEEKCDRTKLPACEVQWYATQWSNCSVQCGKGIQTRRIFCGLFDGTSVLKVDDNRCDSDDKYNDTKSCEVPKEKCPSKWFAGPWSECTKECGGGEQFRKVMCLSGGKEATDCDGTTVLDSTQSCNLGPCDKDETLPVDSKSTPITDEDYREEECEEEEDYEEVGAAEDYTSTTYDDMMSTMFSDSPSVEGSGSTAFTEIESEFTDTAETGSGSEPTVTESLITESSGTGPTDETTETELTGSTESSATAEESSSTESSSTDESSGSTESSGTETSSSTESTATTEESTAESSSAETGESSGSSEATTDITGSTTDEKSSESSTESSTTESGTAESETTDTATTESGTAESETTDTATTESGTTESGTTESGTTDTATTESGTTESGTTESGSTETGSTESESTESESAESGSTESGSTESSTTESGSTEFTESEGSTTEGKSEGTGSTETGGTESTSEGTETTVTSVSGGSTESESTASESSSESESTSESSATEATTETGITEGTETTESGATEETEGTVKGLSTEMSSSEGSTESEGLTESTPWDWSSTVEQFLITKKPRCKRPRPKCIKSKFGCCPDKRTSAAGPFDEGCPNPKTCKESKHGCCPDGVSPALGPKDEGCPVPPCNETLYGCCKSDKKTAAKGNDQEGCPPPPPACKSSKFGCCKDVKTPAKGPKGKGCPEKEKRKPDKGCAATKFGCCHDQKTAATGPNEEGCPCNATKFGCCPDGASPAQGPQMEGCVLSCNTSAHGCCPDGETPAHGPDYEGCCLQSPYGCCPDNYKYAEGPHFEGCGCQYARYGCCPDNVTISRGPSYEGCGCQYTQFGCCPDRHTEAQGPDYEGCGCHTYQFGCCPDGATIAKGPSLQGCHCQYSKFGCCGDGETAASGPDQAGCECSTSKYGCCPDGQTEAKGPKFLDCTDVPENRQAGCSLAIDRGPCRNYSVYWYYDMEYGGCSRFWYGGCEGNGNRFASKEECEDVCVQPPPKDACKLPKVKGACVGYHLRWYYDTTRESCGQFVFGGCLGNANNFESRELCQERCEPAKSDDQCKLPIERGSCAGNYGRWGFNAETHSCEQFVWGGCEGNGNRFVSEAACIMQCNPPGKPQPQCSEPQEVGNCTEKQAVWSFSQTENRCVPFYYTGCGGNGNRFDSEESCTATCPSAFVQDACTLPAVTGDCADYRERWYYDTAVKRCRQFYYGGCGGNANNYATEQECESRCKEQVITTTIPPLTISSEHCFLEKDAGPCSDAQTRWAYDASLGSCTAFQYGGCGGNRNNFPSREYCEHYCINTQDICQLPMQTGPCRGSFMRWFYDAVTDSCSQFTYGGCGGNDNKFDTVEDCERRCRGGQQLTTTTRTPPPGQPLPPECQLPPSLEECAGAPQFVWYLDPSTRECTRFQNPLSGVQCRTSGVFQSEEACLRSCGVFRDLPVCQFPKDPGPCSTYELKFYYNSTENRCEQFYYGGCQGGPNRFSTAEECQQICQPEIDPCRRPSAPGNCLENFETWYYDENTDECSREIVYGGCRSTDARFNSREECEGKCRRRPVGPTTLRAPSILGEECRTPESLLPCGENITMFYYDEGTSSCVAGVIGGCRYANSYRTEEECERRCGQFRGLDVCSAPLNPGPCRASISKVYWDSNSGQCLPFTYGGCQGGPNRFSNVEECEEVCGGQAIACVTNPGTVGADAACLLEVDVGSTCEGSFSQRRWHFDPLYGECIVFIYAGCGGNGNNFVSVDECEARCKSTEDGVNELDCDAYIEECARAVSCFEGFKRVRTSDGCERCICNEPLCQAERQECQRIQCPNGIERSRTEQGCEKCTCASPDCTRYNEECSRLQCPYSIQRSRTADGCEKCTCVPVDIDCAPLRQECETLKCNYGMERSRGEDGCERCTCIDHPCATKECPSGDRCVAIAYRDPLTQEPRYAADCRTVNKPGTCPSEDTYPTDVSTCRRECNDDADCRGSSKCCIRGCRQLCLEPGMPTSRAPGTTTYVPELPQPPQPNPETEPEVTSEEGGVATLRCLFHGNPPPKITWRRGEITIDGTVGRYRLLSDGALEIVSLYRNDSGVYICVADNELGTAHQEVRLQVNDPVERPAGISGEANTIITGELGRSLNIRCLAYGYPQPAIYWYRGLTGPMVPFSSNLYEARGNVLQIRVLNSDTLGEYACQAYNGIEKPASWTVVVQAYKPDDSWPDSPYLVSKNSFVAVTPREPHATTTTTIAPEIDMPVYTVPVSTRIAAEATTIPVGGELSLPCEVDGFPVPDVYWTKDGATLSSSDRIQVTEARLTIRGVSTIDSGVYGCHASNAYSSHSSTLQITVRSQEGIYVPPKCTDNPFFADCHLIVRSKFCQHKYYSKFCCKSCVEAGQLNPSELDMQADESWQKKKK